MPKVGNELRDKFGFPEPRRDLSTYGPPSCEESCEPLFFILSKDLEGPYRDTRYHVILEVVGESKSNVFPSLDLFKLWAR